MRILSLIIIVLIHLACKENTEQAMDSNGEEKKSLTNGNSLSPESLEAIRQIHNIEKSIAEEDFKQSDFYLTDGSSINSIVYFHNYWSRYALGEDSQKDYFQPVNLDKIKNLSPNDSKLLEGFLSHRIEFYKLVYNLALDENWVELLDLFINEDKYIFEMFLAIMTGSPGSGHNAIARSISQTHPLTVVSYFEEFITEILNLGPMETNEEYLNLHIVNYNGNMLDSIVSNAGANEVLAQMAYGQIESHEAFISSLIKNSPLSLPVVGLPALIVDWLVFKKLQKVPENGNSQFFTSKNNLIIGEISNNQWNLLPNSNESSLQLTGIKGIASILYNPFKSFSFRKSNSRIAKPKFEGPKPDHPPLILRTSSSSQVEAFKAALRKKEARIKIVEGYTEHQKSVLKAYYQLKKATVAKRINKLQLDIDKIKAPQNRNAVLEMAKRISQEQNIKFDEKNFPRLVDKLVMRRQERILVSRAEITSLERQFQESVATADANLQSYVIQFNARQIYHSIH